MAARPTVRRRARARRWAGALALALALLAAVAGAPAAHAHAILAHTEPHRGAVLPRAPGEVRFAFNEPVRAPADALRVFDETGERVDTGAVRAVGGGDTEYAVPLRGDLPDGVYTATFRIVSADGHPIAGGLTFSVGDAATGDGGAAPTVAELLERTSASPVVEGAYAVVRGLHYAALLLLVGALFFAAVVWRAAARAGGVSPARWPHRLLVGLAGLGLVCALLGVPLQGALGAAVALPGALDAGVLEGALETRSGQAWLLRAGAWLAVLVVLLAGPRWPARAPLAAVALAAAVLAASLPWAGHAATQHPQAVLVPVDLLHVVAAGAWLGGLVLLLAVFWPPRETWPGEGSVTATEAFSRLALPAVVVLAVAGVVQGWIYLGSLDELLSGTYGVALLAKVLLLGGVVVLGAGNRRRLAALRRLPGPSARALRRAMRAEVGLAVLVLAATAVLVRAAPPASQAAAPAEVEAHAGPMRVELVAEPSRVGPNDLHVYLVHRETGEQAHRVEQVTVELTQPERGIGPISLDLRRRSPGHYALLDQAIGVPGEWQAAIAVRVSDFEEHRVRASLEVRER